MIKGKMSALGGETNETLTKCCGFGRKHKKVLMILIGIVLLAIIVLSIAAASLKASGKRTFGDVNNGAFGRGQMMYDRWNNDYSVSAPKNQNDQFVLPQDAGKSGELAIVVNDLESAKKAVSDIATKSSGSVYATFISYASSNVRNGSIVVQVPVSNFDTTFESLKKIGTQIIQEKTLQIPSVNYYAVPMMGAAERNVSVPQADADENQSDEAIDSKPEIAIYPNPVQPQTVQDKGYIKVVFVDYGAKSGSGVMMQKQNVGASVLGIGNPANQDMRNNLFVIIGIKLILLVAIFGLLIVIFKKIFHSIKRRKGNATRVHVVRQMPKTRQRIVRIARKK